MQIGAIDPILGRYNGVVYRPITNDWCHEYEQNVLGFPVRTHVGCASTKCAVEGNCPPVSSSPSPQQSLPPPVTASQGQILPGVDNIMLFIGIILIAGLGFFLYTKKEGKK